MLVHRRADRQHEAAQPSGQAQLGVGHPQGGGQRGAGGGGREGGQHGHPHVAEEPARAGLAHELDQQRVDDEQVEGEAQQDHPHEGRQRAQEARPRAAPPCTKSKAPTPIGRHPQHALDAGHHDVVEPLHQLAQPQGGLGAGERQGDAEDEGEDDDADHVAVGGGLDRVVGHHADDEVDGARCGARWPPPAPALLRAMARRASPEPPAPGRTVFTRNRPIDTAMKRQPGRVAERPHAHPPELPQLDAGDADHQRGEHQRYHQHEQQPQEDLPHRHGQVGGDPVDPGGARAPESARPGRRPRRSTIPSSIRRGFMAGTLACKPPLLGMRPACSAGGRGLGGPPRIA